MGGLHVLLKFGVCERWQQTSCRRRSWREPCHVRDQRSASSLDQPGVGPYLGRSADAGCNVLRCSVLRYRRCRSSCYQQGGTADGMPVSGFVPPLSGGDMAAEVSPGGMCPAHSKGTTGSGTVGNAAQTNPAMVELLEGQAFYAALAPSQYSLPTTSSTATTQTARAAKQKQCATHITSMMKLNKATAVTAEAGKFGHSYSAINFPLWKVGMQSTFKGAEKFGQLVSGPNMAIVADNEACGRANTACAAAPTTWNGGPAVMATCYGDACTTGGILNTTGAIPVA